MIAFWRNLFRRPTVAFDPLLFRRLSSRRMRSPQFVGYLQSSGFRRSSGQRQNRAALARRWVGQLLVLGAVAGFAWVAVESARALSRF